MIDSENVQIRTLAQLGRGGGWRIETMHSRKDHLFMWVTRGQGRAVLHGTQIGFGPHNALFIPAGTLFNVSLGRQSLGLTVALPASLPLSLPDKAQHLRVRDGIFQLELTALIEAMQRESAGERPMSNEALMSYAGLLSVWVRRMMLESRTPVPRETATQRLVRQYCTLIVENHKSGRPMAAYAEELGITPTHLTRVCRQATGRTAADLLIDCVTYEARNLLEQTSAPIKQVAAELGFASAAYFTRFIQQRTGMTPSQLRIAAQSSPAG